MFSDGESAATGSDFGGGIGGDRSDGGRGNEDDYTPTVSVAVKSCLAGADPFLPCINGHAMAAIEQTESMDSVRLDSGLEISRLPGDEGLSPRGVYTLGKSQVRHACNIILRIPEYFHG